MSSAKDGLAIIIGKLKAQDKKNPYGQHSKLGSLLSKPDDKQADDDSDPKEGQLEAVNDMFTAFEAKNPEGFLEAFQDLLCLCQEASEDEDEDQDIEQDDDHSDLFAEES